MKFTFPLIRAFIFAYLIVCSVNAAQVQVLECGPHRALMQATTTFTNEDGTLGTQPSKYVRLQNGLNKKVDGFLTFIGDYDTATADNYAFYYNWSDALGKIRRGPGFPFLSQPDTRFTRISN